MAKEKVQQPQPPVNPITPEYLQKLLDGGMDIASMVELADKTYDVAVQSHNTQVHNFKLLTEIRDILKDINASLHTK